MHITLAEVINNFSCKRNIVHVPISSSCTKYVMFNL